MMIAVEKHFLEERNARTKSIVSTPVFLVVHKKDNNCLNNNNNSNYLSSITLPGAPDSAGKVCAGWIEWRTRSS